jgi:hypothetical protein
MKVLFYSVYSSTYGLNRLQSITHSVIDFSSGRQTSFLLLKINRIDGCLFVEVNLTCEIISFFFYRMCYIYLFFSFENAIPVKRTCSIIQEEKNITAYPNTC